MPPPADGPRRRRQFLVARTSRLTICQSRGPRSLDSRAYTRRTMGDLGNRIGDLLQSAADSISGLMSGLLGAFSSAVGDLAAIVPGGVIGMIIILVGAVAFGWFLLSK